MNSREILVVSILLGVLGPGVNRAGGEEITWEFSGQITFVSDPNDFLGGAVGVGSPFSGTYTFESTTPDSYPGDPTLGEYNGAITTVSGYVGDLWFLGPVGSRNYVEVQNNFLGSPVDSYVARADVNLLGEMMDWFIALSDNTGTVFSDDSMLLCPPPLEFFTAAGFEMASESVYVNISGDITSLVPEPTTLLLLGVGAFLARNRRYRARVGPK